MAEIDTTRRNVLKLPTAARLPPIPDIEPPQELSNYQSSVGNSDGKDTAEIKWKKSKVEYYVVEQLKIVHPGFNLDEPTNTIYLQPSLHMHLDYGTWAITGSRETLQALIKLFETVNNYWQHDITRTGPQAERLHVIPELYRGFPAVQFDIVLLHPNLFLPLGRSLEIRDDFHGHTSGTLRQPPSYSAWAVVDKELRKLHQSSAGRQCSQYLPLRFERC
ncbi:hypothetical protein A0H81_09044 [Grifola frondosa]|uniref:Uncharacterized protein n=1 Tax=Grifola frondosa TaxID=5627 RepID=A0A1C7M1I7_GRIFR|nr:hypothetical protein A0H81_09044 [Grifola frondosa]